MNSKNMAARAKREKREEMVGIRDVPVLGVVAAVVKIVLMVEERAREREEERNQKLLDEKDRAGFFRQVQQASRTVRFEEISLEDVP